MAHQGCMSHITTLQATDYISLTHTICKTLLITFHISQHGLYYTLHYIPHCTFHHTTLYTHTSHSRTPYSHTSHSLTSHSYIPIPTQTPRTTILTSPQCIANTSADIQINQAPPTPQSPPPRHHPLPLPLPPPLANDPYVNIPPVPKFNTFEERFRNIKRVGITHHRLADTYYGLINMKWGFLFLVVLIFYMFIATIFATGYYICRTDFDPDLADFADCFFLAIGIITSQGSGEFIAKAIPARFIVLIESVSGMIIVALLTGIIYSKFSKPSPRITFSNVLVITRINGAKAIQFRMANERNNFCNDVTLSLTVFLAEVTAEGMEMRRLHDLPLTRRRLPIFAMSHLAHHIIDEQSPIYNMSIADLVFHRAEFFVQIFGTDAGYEQTVHKNHVYSVKDLAQNCRFDDITSFTADGMATMDLRKLSATLPLPTIPPSPSPTTPTPFSLQH